MFSIVCKSDCCDRIEITTNGSVFTKEKALALLDAAYFFTGTVYIRFSIYAVDQDHFLHVTSNQMDVGSIYHNIQTCFDLRNKRNAKNVFLYAKKLRTYNKEDKLFLDSYQNIVDEVALEDPMNWSGDGGEGDFLLKKEYTDDIEKNQKIK